MELLSHCRDHAHKFYGDLLLAAEKTLNDSLFQEAEKSSNDRDQRLYYEAMQRLRSHSGEFHTVFRQELGKSFQAFVSGRDEERSLEDQIDVGTLSLVQRDDLEDELAISVIVSKSNSRNSETLWKLNRRMAVLRGGRVVSDETNPFGPAKVCAALQMAVHQLGLESRARIHIYKQLGKIFVVSFGKLLEQLNKQLMDKGVLPNLRFTVSAASDTPVAPAPSAAGPGEVAEVSESTESATAIANQRQIYQAIRQLQSHTGPRTQTAGGVSLGGLGTAGKAGAADTFSAMDYALALSAIQQSEDVLAAAAKGRALSVAAIEQRLVGFLKKRAAGSDHHQLAREDADTVDLVGMIFRYMLDDPNLGDAVKSLLSHLHTPYLKLALMDSSFLDNYEHSARLLINRMAEVGGRWVQGENDRTVLPKIKQVVENILRGFVDDVSLFDRLLEDFTRFKESLEKRAKMVEKRNTEAQQGLERLEVSKQRAQDEVMSRLQSRKVSQAIIHVLQKPWSDFLAFNLLRHGEESLSWSSALKVVDGVVWSVAPGAVSGNNEDYRHHQQQLFESVERGMSMVGYEAESTRALLNALKEAQDLAYHTRVLADMPKLPAGDKALIEKDSAAAKAAAAEKAAAAAKVAAAEKAAHEASAAAKPAAPSSPPSADEARPARESKPASPVLSKQEQAMLEVLKELKFGTWFEFERAGSKTQLKLAWYSRVTQHYMFVDRAGVKQAVETQIDLARSLCSGVARIIEPTRKSFMERALETVLGKLKLAA